MKKGMSLQQVAIEAQRVRQHKADFVKVSTDLHPLTGESESNPFGIGFQLKDGFEIFSLTNHAHAQLAQALDIPAKYYRRMMDTAPQLWRQNVAHWFVKEPAPKMIRTLDGNVRAIMSNRYRRMDNADLLETVLPLLGEGVSEGNFEVTSQNLSESYLHLKVCIPSITAEIETGDIVRAGIVIRNSEIGLSRLTVSPMVERLVCKNGMTVDEFAESRTHLGRSIETGELQDLISDEAQEAEDRAVWLRVRDIVKACMNPDSFGKIVDRLRAAKGLPIHNEFAAIEQLTNTHGLKPEEGESVLAHLIDGGDLSQYGLIQAVSRMSQEVESYDRADRFERLAGQFVSMPTSEWKPYAGRLGSRASRESPTQRTQKLPY
jgi:hypothetical protein